MPEKQSGAVWLLMAQFRLARVDVKGSLSYALNSVHEDEV